MERSTLRSQILTYDWSRRNLTFRGYDWPVSFKLLTTNQKRQFLTRMSKLVISVNIKNLTKRYFVFFVGAKINSLKRQAVDHLYSALFVAMQLDSTEEKFKGVAQDI